MNALKRLLNSLDHSDTPAPPVKHPMAHATTLECDASAGEERRTRQWPYTMDRFEALTASEGISLPDLKPLTTLVVRTSHSVYRMIVLQDTTVLVQGGAFPEDTIGRLQGSGFGGHLLKLGWVGVGLRMEILVDGKRFITSTVRAITTESDPATYRSQ
jgi:hypothetical protein